MDAKAEFEEVAADDFVSIHAPVMDAKVSLIALQQKRYCFNPRARDGREGRFTVISQNLTVSIHAPVMDANI